MKTKQEQDTAIPVTQMSYNRETGIMRIQYSKPDLSPGDTILTHNGTRFVIGEMLDLRPAFGTYKNEADRPFVYYIKGDILEKKRWCYNQDVRKDREIKKSERQAEKKKESEEKHKPFSWSRTSTK